MQSVDYVVVGGGIVGLSIGSVLSRFGSTFVLERRNQLISETSSRNSGVVHAGIYYPQSSLKTKLCMEGNANIWRLTDTQSNAIMARRIGKWIGSCDESEESTLEKLVDNMKFREIPYEMVSNEQQKKLEPLVSMRTVVNSVNTGIVEVDSLKDFFVRTLDSANTDSTVVLNTDVKSIHLPWSSGGDHSLKDTIRITTQDTDDKTKDAEDFVLHAKRAVVCAAGLGMPELWRHIYGDGGRPLEAPEHHTMYFCRGRYAVHRGKAPLSRLVYPCPLPELVGLGVHSVVDMAGNVRFGPDAVYVNSPNDYGFGDSEKEIEAFLDTQCESVRRYIPSIEREQIFVDYAGIRTKLSGKGMPFRDFLFEEVGTDGLTKSLSEAESESKARLLIVNGIESPGLTACTAIADLVTKSLVGSRKFNSSPSLWNDLTDASSQAVGEMGWFTSADLKAEEHSRPIGSLFLQSMDRDSARRVARRTTQSQLCDRSLPNTPFSFYTDEPRRSRSMSGGGRRHFRERKVDNIFSSSAPQSTHKPVPKQMQSHLNSAMQTTKEPLVEHFMRRKCRTPPFENPKPSLPRPRTPSPLRRSHLSLGNLLPKEEKHTERPAPPPMIKKPLHFGRRHTAAPRSVSEDHREGIRMVKPLQHRSTAPERQAAFLSLGVDAGETFPIRYRNQSNWSIGYFPKDIASNVSGSVSCCGGNTPSPRPAWRGRGRSATPTRREYNIISWTPR